MFYIIITGIDISLILSFHHSNPLILTITPVSLLINKDFFLYLILIFYIILIVMIALYYELKHTR